MMNPKFNTRHRPPKGHYIGPNDVCGAWVCIVTIMYSNMYLVHTAQECCSDSAITMLSTEWEEEASL